MKAQLFSCPMCGHKFDASSHLACASCPLNRGCDMVCCPNCGYNSIDTRHSKLARMAAGLFAFGRGGRRAGRHWRHKDGNSSTTLADVPSGGGAIVSGFSDDLPAQRRAFLQAYGLNPDYKVYVLQHSPVMVIQVENTELALEDEIARSVRVKIIGGESAG